MNVQGIGASSAGLMMTGGVKPHSDGLEPPSPAKRNSDVAAVAGAQTNAAAGGVEASEPRRESQTRLDVYA